MNFVKVAEAQGITEAEIIKSFLESNGIPAELRYESIGKVLGITTDGLGVVKILVPEEKEEEAKKLIESVKGKKV
jgi:hypothetical protein